MKISGGFTTRWKSTEAILDLAKKPALSILHLTFQADRK